MRETSQRMRRVNEALKEILSAAIGRGLKDPRVGFVTVTGVDTTSDLRRARVYVSVLGKQAEKEETLAGLRSAEHYLQGVINRELHVKRIPALEFVYDTSIDQGMRIQALLQSEERALGLDLDDPTAGDEGEEEPETVAGAAPEPAAGNLPGAAPEPAGEE
jgi:ribosome-binding factor A